ncbi:phospholipase A [Algoriphagus sp. AK58]|uniref:phospholipase A n=1 Tax=Algoriphagus sp. AK58 TaxID=1406877 RepID=UPI00164FEA87|nr:phospholipase A [Algoriphagus sp. AK58]MBC6368839.1 phospholipase [Algoriphagus sp. AK58]
MKKLALFFLTFFFSWVALAQIKEKPTIPSRYTTLSESWELGAETNKETFRLIPYKPFYLNAIKWSNHPNQLPQSENPVYSATESLDLKSYEATFQFSFKTKIAQSLFSEKGDIWLAFTQKAFWQVYNLERSRAFRELNFEPELIFNYPVNFNLLGMKGKMIGFSLSHQSNGRDIPLSRSWNRVIFHLGLEQDHWSLIIRPWIRIPDKDDQNPEITQFMGRASVIFNYYPGKHHIYLTASNNLKLKDNHGSAQMTYEYPILKHLNLQMQVFTGYGETLIDYNHRQTTLGFGISFVNW